MLDLQGLHIRAALFRFIREYFAGQEFLEVDTPLRLPVIIPEAHILPVSADGSFLQTSPELCMKRLLARGCEKIFQICPCFRKDERGRNHQEEFTMLEWYRVGGDYNDLMNDCSRLLHHVVSAMNDFLADAGFTVSSPLLRGEIDVMKAERITVSDAFDRFGSTPVDKALNDDSFEEQLVEHIEPELGLTCPAFLCDYPVEHASLARVKTDNPEVAERFELYISGLELANGFTELTDPLEQRLRFEEEIKAMTGAGERSGMPEKFLEDLNSINKAAGIALGVDRLLMLLLGKADIADVVSFASRDLS